MRRRRELIAAAVAVLSAACAADTFVGGDASTDGGDAASSKDGAPQPAQGVSCGPSTCKDGDSCCVYSSVTNDGGVTASMSCHAQCPPPSGGDQLASLGCTRTGDCGSGVCCVHRQNGVDLSSCQPACLASNNEVQLCDPQAADAGCPASQPCSTAKIADWSLPATFATCGGQGVP